ncbi:ROK family protein [Kineococcus vitellinus]|uniref:ROK family protein n=1 Tax=Kineococcus vitellinus TaxID=2696565 RepID=UPI00196A7A0F
MTTLDSTGGAEGAAVPAAAAVRRRGGPGARERLLDALRASGPVSRVELAAITGLTEASVSTTVRRLLQDGVVVEVGRTPTAGKPRTLLQLDPGGRTAVGIDLGPVTTTCVLTSQTGGVLARLTSSAPPRESAAQLVDRLARDVETLIEGSGERRERCLGIGLVYGGPRRGSAAAPGGPPGTPGGLEPELLRAALQEVTGWPVLAENDATAAAVGEYWVARVDAARSFAALYMGTGLGAGIVLAGSAHRGARGQAGEFGHVVVDVDGPPCWCGGQGCLEAVAGPAAVVARALADPVARAEAHLEAGGPRSTVGDFSAVARAARAGGGACRALVEASARYVAAAAESLVNLFDLDLLVLTGPGFAASSSLYGPAITRRTGAAASRAWGRAVTVTVSSAAATAPAVGAAALLLQDRLAR